MDATVKTSKTGVRSVESKSGGGRYGRLYKRGNLWEAVNVFDTNRRIFNKRKDAVLWLESLGTEGEQVRQNN